MYLQLKDFMGKPIMKRIFDWGQVIIFTCVSVMYVQRFFVTDLNGFLGTSGVVFAGLATLCGLSLGFASVVEEKDRRVVSLSGEKLLHATILFLFASLFGVFALQIAAEAMFGELGTKIVTFIFTGFGFYFLIMSFYSAHYGTLWLLDTLYQRFDVRNKSVEKALIEQKEATKSLIEGEAGVELPKAEKVVEQLTKQE
ncbi:MAG: hypothetical protein IPP15_13840 [Saprospiraceae bacterium]|uniref:Uncharacterized protein n=1 Tax=Candidatus Opimibacter skivensis TaxID=2982028 RepID=A0A9D7SUC3_9BACT|nr:hypothetical protein [Candidatus Opimibacter skivensis]